LALPRGGVPVASRVAKKFGAPLDVLIVRKLGVPGHQELAMGAVASGGLRVLNRSVVDALRIPLHVIDAVAQRETEEIRRRENVYRRGMPPIEISDRTVIVVDDGLATGSTMKAAVRAIASRGPKQVIVAVPVGSKTTCAELAEEGVPVVCILKPELFFAVGQWYQDFTQTTDEEVQKLISEPPPRIAGGH
jgi:putative phosphoribosyl transferase